MPDPHATLSIFAEVSAALAGFSGIVIAFGRRTTRALTGLERRRLSNLFMHSGLVLFASWCACRCCTRPVFPSAICGWAPARQCC